MECGICFDYFDAARHRPKVLPCGHSYCLACLTGRENRRCPECQRRITTASDELPDNFNLLTLSETTRSDPRLRLWCCECKSVAQSECRETHILRSTKAVLREEEMQVQSVLMAEDLPEALRVDDDGAREHALRVLELARQPGTTLEVSVRGQGGEAFTATWTSPPAGQQDATEAVEDVEDVAPKVLVLALAKKGLWQQVRSVPCASESSRCTARLHGSLKAQRGEAVGQDGAQGQGEAQSGAVPDLPELEELEVEGDPPPERKDELLRTAREHRVRRLAAVWCDDPAWSLQLLQLAAPYVEELKVVYVRREHLQVVLAMPRLKRLEVSGHSADQSAFPAELPPFLIPNHVGLRWLGVAWLPRETTFSLIRRHAGTLEELWLGVGSQDGGGWPLGCEDLHTALGQCGLARLKRLVMFRPAGTPHDAKPCPAQLSTVQDALPGVQVQCKQCDDVEYKF